LYTRKIAVVHPCETFQPRFLVVISQSDRVQSADFLQFREHMCSSILAHPVAIRQKLVTFKENLHCGFHAGEAITRGMMSGFLSWREMTHVASIITVHRTLLLILHCLRVDAFGLSLYLKPAAPPLL